MFTLNSNGSCDIKKLNGKGNIFFQKFGMLLIFINIVVMVVILVMILVTLIRILWKVQLHLVNTF